jgi:hypothetical protein
MKHTPNNFACFVKFASRSKTYRHEVSFTINFDSCIRTLQLRECFAARCSGLRATEHTCSQAFLAIADVLTACMMQTMMNNASGWK